MHYKHNPPRSFRKLQPLLLLFVLLHTLVSAQTYNGRIGVGISVSSWQLPFVDVAKTTRSYTRPDGSAVPKDALGWPMGDAQTVLMDMRPAPEWIGVIDDPEQFRLDVSGTYKCSFNGQATVRKIEGPFSLGPVAYDAATNTTTFDLTMDPPGPNHGLVILQFLDTKRTPGSATGTGFTNLKAIRPGYDPNTTQLFTNEFVSAITSVDFSTLRMMGGTRTNDNNKFYPEVFEWTERKTMNAATWEGDNVGQENALPWEVIVEVANVANADLWLNVPHAASDDYIRQLATFVKSTLKPELNLYVEYSNEVWNWSFPQSWWNDARAKAQGLNHIKGYSKRTVEMAKIFESVYGAGSLNNKVRVINAWQIGWNPPDAMYEEQMQYINATFGPPKNFIYGLGVAPYFNCGSACETGTVDQILAEMRRSSDASKLDRQKIVGVAAKWQIPGGMVAYEGGSDTGGGSATNIANKIGAERSQAIREVFLRDLRENWFDIGGGLYVYLELVSGYNRYGSWGLTDDIRNLDRNYKMGAVRDLIGTPATTPPPAPQGLTAVPVGNANVNLSWSVALNANSYTVKRSTTSGGPYTSVGTTITTGLNDNTVTNGTTYYYVVSATNALGESANSGEVSVTPTAVVTIRREFWSNVSGTSITAIPVTTPPTGVEELTALDAPQNIGDNYAARMRAYLKPATSGAYTFYIASDDQSQLWLSTNNQPAGKVKLAEVTDWTSYQQWDKLGTQRSAAINLVAGQEYYLEVLHKEGTGGDHVSVGWTGPGIGTITVIGSPYLAPYTGTDAPAGPAAPTGLAATAGNASVSLTWNAVAGATTYNIKRHTGGNFNTVATGITTNSYQDNNLVNGTTYFYVVTAVNANGESNISNTVQVTPVSGGGQTGTLASWDFTASSGQTSVATTMAMPGVSTTAPSLVASLASGLIAVDYFSNSLIGRGQTATSLADAITGNDYISFTIAPASGGTLSISTVKIRPISQSGARTFVLMSSVSGFTAGNGIATFTSEGEQAALTTISITGHSNLSSAVEFRLYVFGNTNEWEAVGIGNRASSLAEADLIVEGSTATSSTVAVTGVSVSPTSASLSVGGTRQVTATVAPANATNKNVSWSSSNPSVATVNATGLVTAVASGSATITATTQDGSFTATTAVTVTPVSGGGSVLASWDFSGKGGQSSVATTTAMPGVSTTAPSLVASMGPGLTAVDYFINAFTGRGQTATSLADAITGNDYISFTVAPIAGSTVSISSVKIRPFSQNRARTFVLMSNVSGFSAGNGISTFSSQEGDGSGLNTINITGHSNRSSAVEFRLYVFGPTDEWEGAGIGNRASSLAEADLIVEGSTATSSTVAVTGVSLSPTSANISVGDTRQLTATVAPANATNRNVSWSSSNPSVATVSAGGLVTAVASGSAAITVTTQDGSFAATTAVTVPVVVVPDTQAPTAPAGLAASAITTSGFTVNWTAATDNVGVTAYKVYRNDALVATTTNTTAQLTGLSAQTTYSVRVTAEDAAGNVTSSGPLAVTTAAPAPVTLTREVWNNLTGKGIAGIPVNTPPTSTTQLTTLEGPADAADNYGARIRAYLTPAVSGNYTFYLAGDDVAQLWLSFNDNPGQSTKIAEVTKAVKPREWTKSPAQKSTARNLTAGVKYYIEVLHRETSGKDHVAVGWTGPGIPAITVIGGSVLSPFGITTPPPVTGEGRPAYNTGKGFFMKNAKIYDANGNDFIPIGYNGTVFWQNEECQKNSLDDIARTGANTVRLVQVIPAERNNWSWGSRTENHRAIVASSVANKLVPMLEFHDATCGSLYENDPEGPAKSLKPIVDYWVSPAMVQLCQDYEKELMVNIANEWGSRENLVEWKNAYKTSIARMRQAGIKNLIVIDAGGNCGQYPDGVIQYAQEIIDSDPEKNVLFSIHMYAFWYSGTTNAAGWRFQVEAKLQEFKTRNIPIVIGEFGWEGTSDVSYDPRVVMAKAAELEMGWLFWSWFDQPQNIYYNIVKDGCTGYNSDADLTVAGNNIVNGANGVRAKSKLATIYTPAPATRQAAAGREAGLSRPESTDELLLYPNPVTSGRLTVQFVAREKGKATVTLVGVLGQSALKQESAVEAGQNKIDVSTSALPGGLYMLTLEQGSHRIVRKVLIN